MRYRYRQENGPRLAAPVCTGGRPCWKYPAKIHSTPEFPGVTQGHSHGDMHDHDQYHDESKRLMKHMPVVEQVPDQVE